MPILLLVTACISLNAVTNSSRFKGKISEQVISELIQRGYQCSEKKEIYMPNWKETVGVVQCGLREKSPMCPDSYGVSLTIRLATNQIITADTDKSTNCF